MDRKSNDERRQSSDITHEFEGTRRRLLAAGGVAVLSGLAGCSALDGLLDRASEQVVDRAGEQIVGTTVSSPAAFYPGRTNETESYSFATLSSSDADRSSPDRSQTQIIRSDEATVREVPVSITHQGRLFELEGWSISTSAKANDYNSVRSNKRRSEWWGGPDDDHDDDEEGDILVDILDTELELLRYVATGLEAVDRRSQAEAKAALDGFIDTTTEMLRPALDRCGTGVCETIREHSDGRKKGVEQATDAVETEEWLEANRLLQEVEETVLGDIERLDDELVERRPGRPRFIDIIDYLRDEPTIGERFTICLPETSLPGDRGSLAEQLTPERVLAYFAPSHEPDRRRAPFHDQYGSQGITYDNGGCLQLDGPVSLHEDLSCGSILSAELDTYRTVNRGIAGFSTEGGAVVSGVGRNPQTGKEIQRSSEEGEIDGRCVFVAADGTLREAASLKDREVQCWGQKRSSDDESLYCWGSNRAAGNASVSETLVCPVSVTPEDCPCPLPGIFYMRRCIHDEQLIYAGGWMLDEGALFEDSATLLFDEGPTEIASVTPADIESDDYDDRIVSQFSRDRSQRGSAAFCGKLDADGDGWPAALKTDKGRKGLNAVNVKVIGEQGDVSDDDTGPQPWATTVALDAPLVHLANAAETETDVKFKAGAELSKSVN